MNTKGRMLVLIVVIIIVGAAAWYFAAPLLISKEVNEEFPVSTLPPQNTQKPSFPTTGEIEAMLPEERDRLKEEMMNAALTEPDTITAEPMPTIAPEENETTVLSGGMFVGADSFHRTAGSATIYRLPDGARILRFEDFEATNGPDLRVLLARGGNPATSIELGDLKGNKGNQNYDIPENVDLSDYDSVIIYCKPFHVTFGAAPLKIP